LETALAVHLGSGLPVWACVSAGGLERIALPENVRDVFIFADHDASQTGQRAAERLARRLQLAGRFVRTRKPAQPGTDWLDVYTQSQQAKEAA
jgi:putative DNA primase/helicase